MAKLNSTPSVSINPVAPTSRINPYLITRFDGQTPVTTYRILSTWRGRNSTSAVSKETKKQMQAQLDREKETAIREYAVWTGERIATVFAYRGYSRKECTDAEIIRMGKQYHCKVEDKTIFSIVKGTVLAGLYSAQRHEAHDYGKTEMKPRAFSAMSVDEFKDLSPKRAGLRIHIGAF